MVWRLSYFYTEAVKLLSEAALLFTPTCLPSESIRTRAETLAEKNLRVKEPPWGHPGPGVVESGSLVMVLTELLSWNVVDPVRRWGVMV